MDTARIGKNTFGRRKLYTDIVAPKTSDDIAKIFQKAISEHLMNVVDEQYLYEYEKGRQPILDRVKPIRSDINNKVALNIASRIVDVHTGYCFSNPVMLVQAGQEDKPHDKDADDTKIGILNKMFREQKKASKDLQMARDMMITGLGYEMIWPTRRKSSAYSPFELMRLSPLTTFVVYSNDAYKEPVAAFSYYVRDNGTYAITAYTPDWCFSMDSLDQRSAVNIIRVPNLLHCIPIVEFSLPDRCGVFEKVIPILDAINIADSDRLNDVAQHVQSLLWLNNCEIDKEQKKSLVDGDGVIMTKSDSQKQANIQYLSQVLNQSEIQTLLDHLTRQAEEITSTPSWQEASGGSTTGAMQLSNGWQSLEISAKAVEIAFDDPEVELLSVALAVINVSPSKKFDSKVRELEIADIEIKHSRTKTYDLNSKTNALVSMLNAGVNGLDAMTTVSLFTDPQQVWNDSKKIINGMQKKLADEEKPATQNVIPNANAAVDENGLGGKENDKKDATEESKQPSKVAGVEE